MANNTEETKTEGTLPATAASGGIYKSVALVFIVSIVCRVFGFLREVTIAYKFGTSAEVDAYNMAISIFNIFALLFGTMLTTAYTPLYTHTLNERGRKEADRVTSNILNILMILAVGLTILCMIFAPQIAGLIAKGFTDPGKMQMTVDMSRILFPGLPLFGLYYFFIAILNAQKEVFYCGVCHHVYRTGGHYFRVCPVRCAGGLFACHWYDTGLSPAVFRADSFSVKML